MKYYVLTDIGNSYEFRDRCLFHLLENRRDSYYFTKSLTGEQYKFIESNKFYLGEFNSLKEVLPTYFKFLDSIDDFTIINIAEAYICNPNTALEYLTKVKESYQVILDFSSSTIIQASLDYFGENRLEVTDTDLIIYFPENEVKNSNGKTHKIYETYMKIKLNNCNLSKDMCLLRTRVSEQEDKSRYLFSHASNSGNSDWRGCCVGDNTPIADFLKSDNVLNYENTIVLFNLLEQYLSWESIEGGPYIFMSQIGFENSNLSHITQLSINKSLKFLISNEEEEILNTDAFLNLTLNPNPELSKKYCSNAVVDFGNYKASLSGLNNLEVSDKVEIKRLGSPFKFQGGEITEIKIDYSLNKTKEELMNCMKLIPHPEFYNKINDDLSIKISEFKSKNASNYLIKNEPKKERVAIATT